MSNRAWQRARGEQRSRIPHITHGDEVVNDTFGRTLWRQNLPAEAEYRLIKGFAPTHTHRRGLGYDTEVPSIPDIEQIAIQTDTHVEMTSFKGPHGFLFKIWGDPVRALSARARIEAWAEELDPTVKDARKSKWAKIHSITPAERPRYEKMLEAEAERQSYRKAPPSGVVFLNEAYIPWPTATSEPEAHFGRNLELFDPIRTENYTYINYNRMERWFELKGKYYKRLEEAATRVRNAYCEILSRSRETLALRYIMPLTSENVRTHVLLVPEKQLGHVQTGGSPGNPRMLQIMSGKSLSLQERKNRLEAAQDSSRNMLVELKKAFLQTFLRLGHYRAHVQLRARLGVFLLTSYKKDLKHTISDFEGMMEEEQVDGHITQGLGKHLLEQNVQQRLLTWKYALSPLHLHHEELEEVKPSYSGKFVVTRRKDDSAYYQLEATYDLDIDNVLECRSKTWSTLGKDQRTFPILNIDLIDVDKQSAWNIELSVKGLVHDDPLLEKFAEAVEVIRSVPNLVLAANNGDRYIGLKQLQPSLKIESYQQRCSWTFTISEDGLYMLELSQTQSFMPCSGGAQADALGLIRHGPIRWSISVFRPEWDTILAEHALHGIGQDMKNNLHISKFFPDQDGALLTDRSTKGLENFLRRLTNVEDLVYGR